jgi:hypothetical protein
MKTQMTAPKFFPSLLIVVLAIAAGYVLAILTLDFNLQPFEVNFESSAPAGIQDPGELSAYRWTAMAKAYERMGLLNDNSTPGDLDAYRWTAMAKAYERFGLLNYHDNPDDLLAYRWQAMAEAYQKRGLLNTP